MSTLRVRVAAKEAETAQICRLELVPVEGDTLPPFTAGAHVELHLPGNLIRAYSLCNDPAEQHRYVLGVLKDANSRGGSQAVHEQVQPGDELTIGVPRNHFALDPKAKSTLLLGGGIGITPLLSMAERLHRDGTDFELHYTVAKRDRLAFGDRLKAAPYAERTHVYFSQEADEDRIQLDAAIGAPETDRHLYVCGPQRFIDGVLESARGLGWAESNLHWEFFGGAVTSGEGDQAFDLKIAGSDQVVHVPVGQTALKALHLAGVDVPVACEQGVCGTCLTRVTEGTIDHRDLYLTEDEQAVGDQFLPCCSRAKSACLVIEL